MGQVNLQHSSGWDLQTELLQLPVMCPDSSPPIPLLNYVFTCRLFGAENLNPSITYQWTKDNGTQIQVGTNSSILSFFLLRLSDAGGYSCQGTVTSNYIGYTINLTTDTQEVGFQGKPQFHHYHGHTEHNIEHTTHRSQ